MKTESDVLIVLKCNRCKYEWNYGGKKKPKDYPTYTSCPRCRSSVKIASGVKSE